MPFLELFSSSFLLTIAVVVILIGVVFAYISYRMSDQDHKISSMVSLVSSMAEELQFFRSKMNGVGGGQMVDMRQQQQRHNGLIQVSDDEYEEDTDSETDSEQESEQDSASETESYVSENENEASDSEDGEAYEDLNVKSIQLHDEDIQPLDEENVAGSLDDDVIDLTKLPIPHIEETHEHEHEHDDTIKDVAELKTISISEEIDESYKKMSLTKLRSLVMEKGLVMDASKLKKNELLKLLEDE